MSKTTEATNGTIVIDGITFVSGAAEKSDVTYIKAKDLKAGDVAVAGKFLGTVKNKLQPEKPDYKFEKRDGTTIILNSNGNLAYRMSSKIPGQLMAVIYLGKNEYVKDGKTIKSHNFDVKDAE